MKKKSYLVFSFACLILLIAVMLYKSSFDKINSYRFWVNHTTDVIFLFDALANDVKNAEMIPLYQRLGDGKLIMRYYAGSIYKLPDDLNRLHFLTKDNMLQSRRLDSIKNLVNTYNLYMGPNQLRDAAELADFLKIQQLVSNGIATENKLLADRKAILDNYIWQSGILMIVSVIIAVVLIISIIREVAVDGFVQDGLAFPVEYPVFRFLIFTTQANVKMPNYFSSRSLTVHRMRLLPCAPSDTIM